ncbi:MAG: lytic transglycosylase domain-containing protein [Rhodoferax sp.]|nr:lytic transglycosylase domain-containing protein [Rhodoferax sp.]
MTATCQPSAKGPFAPAEYLSRRLIGITHTGFALLGLALVFVIITLVVRPELRLNTEMQLMEWLRDRHFENYKSDPNAEAVDRSTASDPKDLPKQQAAIAFWLSKKYNVAPEPLSALVVEAYDTGRRHQLDPTLILAVMAVESGFNPFAQSHVGAQGLMQVMTTVHSDKYEGFGGKLAAFDPISNLRVGAKVLQDCIKKAGSVESGLKFYVGAANLEDDGGYSAKVLAEHGRLQAVAMGRPLPAMTPFPAKTAVFPVQSEPARVENVASLDTAAQ